MRRLIARMGSDVEAGNFLCHNACRTEQERAPESFETALVAKYFTSLAAVRAASDAVQLRGAAGCHESSLTARHYGGAKIMEIIEGTTQVHEDLLGKMYLGQAGSLNR
jgi:alkylation response protein AidB-like acyl-CoA dehydrogenase